MKGIPVTYLMKGIPETAIPDEGYSIVSVPDEGLFQKRTWWMVFPETRRRVH